MAFSLDNITSGITGALTDVQGAAKDQLFPKKPQLFETTSDQLNGLKFFNQRNGLVNRNSVLGMPPSFDALCDPQQRMRLQMMSPPPIVSIMPGVPSVGKDLSDKNKELAAKLITRWADDNASDNQSLLEEVYLSIKEKADKDGRLLQIEPALPAYFKVLHVLLARVGARFGNSKIKTFISDLQAEQWGSMMYYMDKGSNFSESGSNEYGESIFSQVGKSVSSMSQEFQALRNNIGVMADQEKAISQRHKEFLSGAMGADPNGLWSKLGAALSGDQLMIPMTWKSSNFSRNYSLSFVFESIAGDRDSIFKHVYLPYLSLLGMCLPLQTSMNSYSSPFLVRVDCPGLFTIDTGAITSFSFRKSMEHLTYENLTRRIEVQIEVQDLYPALMLSPDYDTLNANFGLVQYLDNLAAVDYTRLGDMANIVERMHGSVAYQALGIGDRLETGQAALRQMIDKANPFRGFTL